MDARLSLAALLLVGLGCSSSSSSTRDASKPDGAIADDAVSDAPACGAAPVTLVVLTNAGNVFIPAPEVTVAWDGCAARPTTDVRGEATVALTAGETRAPRFSRAGLTTTLWPEVKVAGGQRLTNLVLRDSMGEAYGLKPSEPLLWVKVQPGSACAGVDGVELAVDGHPEAKPEYVHGDGPVDPTLRATTTAGSAVFRGLPAGTKVRVTGRKSGCTVSAGPWGAIALENGVMSTLPLYLE